MPGLGCAELSGLAGSAAPLATFPVTPRVRDVPQALYPAAQVLLQATGSDGLSLSLFFGQEKADAAEGDAGGLWRGYLPGDCHHSHGDAQNPAARCRTHWYVDFSSLFSEQGGGKELGLGFQGGAQRMSGENSFLSPALPRQRYRRCSRSFSSSSQLTSPHTWLSWLCRGPCS